MTDHIEEARKVWGYFKGGSAGGTEAMQWFDNNKSCGGPAYLIEVFRAALAAAEERGRTEERERFHEAIIPAYMGLLVLKTMCRKAKLIGGVAATESALSSLVSVMPELPAISALRTPAITKEPTP